MLASTSSVTLLRGACLAAAALAVGCAQDTPPAVDAPPAETTNQRLTAPSADDGPCPGGDAELLDAAFRGDRRQVSLCLSTGAWVDATDGSGSSALDLAVLRGHADVARLLVESGAQIVQDGKRNPLAAAAREGHVRIVDVLLAAGADPSASWLDKPALLHAIDRRRTEIALDLIDAGANVHGHDGGGRSALAAAVDAGNRVVVDALLAQGADPTEPCPGGSPLERAEARPDLSSLARRLAAEAGAQTSERRVVQSADPDSDEELEELPEIPADDDPYAQEPPPDLKWPPPPRGVA